MASLAACLVSPAYTSAKGSEVDDQLAVIQGDDTKRGEVGIDVEDRGGGDSMAVVVIVNHWRVPWWFQVATSSYPSQ